MKKMTANKKEKNTVGNKAYNVHVSHSLATACMQGRYSQLKKKKQSTYKSIIF